MNVAAIVIDKKMMKPADWFDGDVTRGHVMPVIYITEATQCGNKLRLVFTV